MKGMIVALVAIAVAAILVLFYGALRPAGDPDDAQAGVRGGLGWLVPRQTLEFADVAEGACAEAGIPGFAVAGGAECTVPLPDHSQITLCVADAATRADLEVFTEGREYPRQPVKPSQLACESPAAISIYDTETMLTMRCAALAGCAVRVVAAEG